MDSWSIGKGVTLSTDHEVAIKGIQYQHNIVDGMNMKRF